jgi:hypothetical protein
MELNNRLTSVGSNLSANSTASQQEAEEEAAKNLSPMELLQQVTYPSLSFYTLPLSDLPSSSL